MLANTSVNPVSAKKLADATERCWQAMLNGDAKGWGEATRTCFEAQLEMYPNMLTADVSEAVGRYRSGAYGWKLTGCGGGGYLILISDREIPNAIKVQPCRNIS